MFSTQEIKHEVQAFLTDGIELVRKEVQLAKAEINEKVTMAQSGVMSLIASIVVAQVGLIFLGYAAVAYLTTLTSPIWAGLIVSLVLFVISIIMLTVAKSNLNASELKPRRTINAAQNIANELGGKSNA